MATTNDLKNGLVLNIDGQLWTVVEFQHVKPGKGGAFVRTTLKNVLSGKVVDRTFNAGTKVETATVDKRAMTFLYKEGEDFVFMDGDTYEQMHVPAAVVGDGANYLLDNAEAVVAVHEGVAALHRAADLGRAADHLHRAGPAGRPGHRWHQARHRRDRRRGAGAAVRHHRREDQDRHPGRPLPRPDQQLSPACMAARSKARKRAVDLIYEADLRGADPVSTLAERVALADPPINDYTIELIEGVSRAPRRRSTSCSATTPRAGRWSGCPGVDRAVLRIGLFELLWAADVPDAVAIDEAVELAKALSTDESPKFVNGILGRVLRDQLPADGSRPHRAPAEPPAGSGVSRPASPGRGRPSPARARPSRSACR